MIVIAVRDKLLLLNSFMVWGLGILFNNGFIHCVVFLIYILNT